MKKYGASPSYFTRNDMRWLHLERQAGGTLVCACGGDPQPYTGQKGYWLKTHNPKLERFYFFLKGEEGKEGVMAPGAVCLITVQTQRIAKKAVPTPNPREPSLSRGRASQSSTPGEVPAPKQRL